ncbi:MAG: DNA mismatch repair protein MutS [Bacteroidota bacterium]
MEALKKRLWVSSVLRLVVFGMAILGIYVFFGNLRLILALVLLAMVVFLFLVSRHTDLKYERDRVLALVKINKTELRVLDRNFDDLPEGNEFKDSSHFYSQDVDLFGKGSFYQYCNRTALRQGSEKLAELFAENSIEHITEKQEGIKELSQKVAWRQNFSAIASLVRTELSHTAVIQWIGKYKPFVPKFMERLSVIFTAVSVALWVLYFLDGISGWWVTGWFFLGLGISLRYLKSMNRMSGHASKILGTFQQYQKLILQLEEQEFQSEWLAGQRKNVVNNTNKASQTLKRFAKLLGTLDQRNNIIIGIAANGFFLRDLWLARRIEKWILEHGPKVGCWFNTIAFFDAHNSLGNFAFNHPTYTFPTLTEESIVLKTQDAGHPLLSPEKCIANDLVIKNEQFLIITGANMAGKSTFLRTVSLQILMANMGLPICASHALYSPIKLITSMRTADSLSDDSSYFFSELKRLKFIVDEMENDRYFIVLDEILKGTNSKDKARGSREFVERLVASKSTGLIATHDLSLCAVSDVLSQVQNYYFDAQIIDGELFFDYKFKKGICQNMNASFLLRKMGIVE